MIVQGPNGPLQFPDDMSQDEILVVMRKEFPPEQAEAPKKAEPTPTYTKDMWPSAEPAAKPRVGSVTPGAFAPSTYLGKPSLNLSPLDIMRSPFPATMLTPLQTHELITGKKTAKTSAMGSAARFAARSAAPVVGGALTGAGLGGVGGTLAGPIGTVVGGVGGSVLGAGAVAMGQEEMLKHMSEDMKAKFGQADWQLESAANEHPYASFAGSLAPSLLLGKPSFKAASTIGNGALGAIGEGAQQFMTGEQLDPTKILLAGGAGALTAAPNRLGRMVYGEAEGPLNAHLRADRPSHPDALARFDALRDAKVNPVPLEILDPTRAKGLTIKAAGKSPNRAGELIRKYAEQVPETINTDTRAVTPDLAPRAPGLTPARALTAAENNLQAVSPQPEVAPGEGGRALQTRLTSEHNASEQGMREAYDAAAQTPDAKIASLDSGKPDATWRPNNKDGVKGYRNTLTDEWRPADEMGPKGSEDIGDRMIAALKESGADLEDPETTGAILRQIDKAKSAGSARELLDIERILTRTARDNPDAPKGENAKIARRVLRDSINQLHDAGRFVDDYGYSDGDTVEAWNKAIGAAREHHSVYSQGDAIEKLSNPTFRGQGDRTTELDPDYVLTHLIGPKGNVSMKANGSRDLAAIRKRMGADSPEWTAFQKEASRRVLGDDPAKMADRLAAFDKNPKGFVDLIVTPEDRAIASQAAGAVSTKAAVGEGVKTGADFVSMEPSDFADSLDAARRDPKALSALQVSARKVMTDALAEPKSTQALLTSIVHNEAAQTNLSALLGPKEAGNFIRRATVLVKRANIASAMDPGIIPQPAGQHGQHPDEASIRLAATLSGHGAAGWSAGKLFSWLKGQGMSETQAYTLAQDALDPAKTEDTLAFVKKLYGENKAQAFAGRVRASSGSNAGTLNSLNNVVTRAGSNWDTKPGRRKDVPELKMPDPVNPDPEGAVPQADGETASSASASPKVASLIKDLGPDKTLALMAAGEASNDPNELEAVIRVALNRKASGKFGSDWDQILHPSQFNAMENPRGLMRTYMGTKKYRDALATIARIKENPSQDPTGNALFYYAPDAQAQLHRTNPKKYTKLVPDFAVGKEGAQIGKSRFYGG